MLTVGTQVTPSLIGKIHQGWYDYSFITWEVASNCCWALYHLSSHCAADGPLQSSVASSESQTGAVSGLAMLVLTGWLNERSRCC